MKQVIEILALLLITFALLLCYGLGAYCMYEIGWFKAFYLSLISVIALIGLSVYLSYDIKKTVKNK